MQTKYLYEKTNPLLPSIGDIRIVSETKYDSKNIPSVKINVVKCVEIRNHHVVYEFLGTNYREAIPFELIESWGYLSIDSAVKNTLNAYMEKIINSTTCETSETFSVPSNLSDYFTGLKNLFVLSRQVLKEAEKARKIYSNTISKENT